MLAAMQYAPKGQTIHMALRAGLHAAKHPIEFPSIIMVRDARLEELQVTLSWKTTERLRKPYDKIWTRKISAVLAKAGQAAANALRPNDFAAIERAIKKEFQDLPALYERMYRQVGNVFADRAAIVARRLLGQEQRSNVFEETPEARKWVRTQTGKHIKDVTAGTMVRVRVLVDRGFTDGLTMGDIAKQLRESHSFSTRRAFRIARTEVAAASNAGNHFATAAILPKDRFSKVWASSRDVRVRDSHRGGTGADGQTRDMDKPFNLPGGSLMFPGDSSLGASGAEIIQCRCTTIHKPKKGVKPSRKPRRPQALPPAPSVRKPVRPLSGIHASSERIDDFDTSRRRIGEIEERARAHDLSVNDYKALVEKNSKVFLSESDTFVRIPVSAMDDIIKSGRFKSQFETGTSGGLMNHEFRSNFENRTFSILSNSDVKKRPIYGHLANSSDGWLVEGADDMASEYGSISFKMKKDLQRSTTFVQGDSLEFTSGIPSPVREPSFRSFKYGGPRFDPSTTKSVSSLEGVYVEAQIHGGVDLSRVDTVFFSDPKNFVKYAPKLKGFGINSKMRGGMVEPKLP